MPQGQAAMRAARSRHDAANPDAAQRRRESAAVSNQKNKKALQERKAELWDQRMATLRQFGLAHRAV